MLLLCIVCLLPLGLGAPQCFSEQYWSIWMRANKGYCCCKSYPCSKHQKEYVEKLRDPATAATVDRSEWKVGFNGMPARDYSGDPPRCCIMRENPQCDEWGLFHQRSYTTPAPAGDCYLRSPEDPKDSFVPANLGTVPADEATDLELTSKLRSMRTLPKPKTAVFGFDGIFRVPNIFSGLERELSTMTEGLFDVKDVKMHQDEIIKGVFGGPSRVEVLKRMLSKLQYEMNLCIYTKEPKGALYVLNLLRMVGLAEYFTVIWGQPSPNDKPLDIHEWGVSKPDMQINEVLKPYFNLRASARVGAGYLKVGGEIYPNEFEQIPGIATKGYDEASSGGQYGGPFYKSKLFHVLKFLQQRMLVDESHFGDPIAQKLKDLWLGGVNLYDPRIVLIDKDSIELRNVYPERLPNFCWAPGRTDEAGIEYLLDYLSHPYDDIYWSNARVVNNQYRIRDSGFMEIAAEVENTNTSNGNVASVESRARHFVRSDEAEQRLIQDADDASMSGSIGGIVSPTGSFRFASNDEQANKFVRAD